MACYISKFFSVLLIIISSGKTQNNMEKWLHKVPKNEQSFAENPAPSCFTSQHTVTQDKKIPSKIRKKI